MNDLDLLDAAKEKTGSDTATARRIGSTQQNICAVRNGRRELSAAQAAQLAELIGKPWIDEAFSRLAKKEKTQKAARFWTGKSETLREIGKRAALGVLLASTLVHGGLPDSLPCGSESASRLYIMLTVCLFFALNSFCPSRSSFAQKMRADRLRRAGCYRFGSDLIHQVDSVEPFRILSAFAASPLRAPLATR